MIMGSCVFLSTAISDLYFFSCSTSRTEREGTTGGDWRKGKRERRKRWRGRRDEFHVRATRLYTFLQGCASCSLSSPPPPKLTHHAARTHASHTLKHIHPPAMVPTLPPAYSLGQEVVTFSFFLFFFRVCPLFHCFLHHCHHHSFLFDSESCFPFYLLAWIMGNKMVLISWVCTLPPSCLSPFVISLPSL